MRLRNVILLYGITIALLLGGFITFTILRSRPRENSQGSQDNQVSQDIRDGHGNQGEAAEFNASESTPAEAGNDSSGEAGGENGEGENGGNGANEAAVDGENEGNGGMDNVPESNAVYMKDPSSIYDGEFNIRNDNSGVEEHGNGIWRIPLIAKEDIGFNSELPGIVEYNIDDVEIALMTAEAQEMADEIGIPLNTPTTFIQVRLNVHNIAKQPIYFEMNQSILTVNNDVTAICNAQISSSMGGELRENRRKDGSLYFVLPTVEADEITTMTLRMPSPTDLFGRNLAEDILLRFNF